jgi:hypothetical protein
MRRLFIIAIALLGVGASGSVPNPVQRGTADAGHTIAKPDSTQKTDTVDRDAEQSLPKFPALNSLAATQIVQPQGKSAEEQAKQYSLDLLTRRYMCATIIGVVGAWIGLAILITQTVTSRRTAQRQLRAYVLCESGSIFNVANPIPLFPGQIFQPTGAEITNRAAGPGALIQIKNTGQTPAFKASHWGNICFREAPLRTGLPARLPLPFTFPSVLGPGIISTKLLQLPQPLTPAEVNDLRNGTGAVYVYGEITYEDAFGRKQQTHYRLLHHQQGGAIGVSTNLSFADAGNEAT